MKVGDVYRDFCSGMDLVLGLFCWAVIGGITLRWWPWTGLPWGLVAVWAVGRWRRHLREHQEACPWHDGKGSPCGMCGAGMW